MKNRLLLLWVTAFVFSALWLSAQDQAISPSVIGVGQYHGLSGPLRDMPALTEDEYEKMILDANKPRNEDMRERVYPYQSIALPVGDDPAWQRTMGKTQAVKAPIVSFDGQSSPYFPPDANGTAGPNHYMQTVNSVYAIYSKTGALVAGPTNLNLLFGSVTGATCNDGDPIVLYDEQAARWLVIEFSICGTNDYMLVAVSQTNDPTGSWHRYSFDVDDMPDYEKIGIWQDGYYMGTNNSATGKKDIYVFERSKMLNGLTPQMVGFDNAWRPTTIDGFMCVPPVDNDGTFAPAGSPGLFITINDDAIAGGSDQLWIYELAVNWTTPTSSTFNRVQQLSVPAFDSNFGANWDNIKQPGTTRELDAIPQVVMNAPQYRNFGTFQTLVCCHTVDVDNTDHAGIRWYELRKTSGTWSLRQSGTYAPDAHSRWMGSIRLNGQNEIGLGYSISSTTVYPGIRYTGQSSTAYATGAGALDLAEQTITTGAYSQTSYNRWGDYAGLSVDPADDKTFWFTTEYIGVSQARKTRVASFQVGTAPAGPDLVAQNPSASPSSIQNGLTTTASCTVYNQGGASAVASSLKYYLSTDNTYSAGDVLLATDAVTALNASASAAVSEVVTIPSSTTPGTYFILFFADANAQVTETNESNNVSSFQVVITSSAGSPDLLVQTPAAAPATLNAGQTTTASCTVFNQGTAISAASNLKYYLSADNVYGTGDTYLATDAITSLGIGSGLAVSEVLTIPSATAAGTWYILFVADADAQVAESNETNNVSSVTIVVQVVSQGCNSTTLYPSSTLTPTTSWKTQNSIYAGEYAVFNVTSGRVYHFSYCSADGATASYDSELTLRNRTTDAFIAYSDDACGDDAKIIWTATFTGTVKLVTTVYGCGTNTTSTKLRYKYTTAKEAEGLSMEESAEYLVYPNPTNGLINVEATNGFGDYRYIAVYDVSGKEVSRFIIPEKSENLYTVNIEDQPAGYYLVRIIGNKEQKQFKVLLTR
ncbi:MAG: T9SS type A sorting domain-containing protein [Bacteroidales bacterium]|nr:T9SS type A sorting domain-containing protein [Bacteroidales bacterium]